MLRDLLRKCLSFFSSLKLAILLLLVLSLELALGTVFESLWDTPTAQYWVYKAWHFRMALGLLAINIYCVALSRFPWKWRHLPFLTAHLGILILLAGSWITDRAGLDASLRIKEGEEASLVELDSSLLYVSPGDSEQFFAVPMPWIPPHRSFQAFSLERFKLPYPLQVDQYLTHAEPEIDFIVADADTARLAAHSSDALAAVKFKVVGGPMRISEELWLWQASPSWREVQAGPALFVFNNAPQKIPQGPVLYVDQTSKDSVTLLAINSEGKKVETRIALDSLPSPLIRTGWRGDVLVSLEQWIPEAMPRTRYHPAAVQYGSDAPNSAIHIRLPNRPEDKGLWLGLGERGVMKFADLELTLAYLPKRLMLPLSLKLERFEVKYDPGSLKPAAYSSRVLFKENNGKNNPSSAQAELAQIEMNHPLELAGYTFYQSSYEDAKPRPVVSIFSVNRDPGRPWKYAGSLLIVFGTLLLFAKHWLAKRYKSYKKSKAPARQASSTCASILTDPRDPLDPLERSFS